MGNWIIEIFTFRATESQCKPFLSHYRITNRCVFFLFSGGGSPPSVRLKDDWWLQLWLFMMIWRWIKFWTIENTLLILHFQHLNTLKTFRVNYPKHFGLFSRHFFQHFSFRLGIFFRLWIFFTHWISFRLWISFRFDIFFSPRISLEWFV